MTTSTSNSPIISTNTISHSQQHQLLEVTQGNVLLMEATYLELISNMRALHSSNQALEEALETDPNDSDFQQALKENKYILLKKRQQTVNLVTDMKRMGVNIDVPMDIQRMQLDLKRTTAVANDTAVMDGDCNSRMTEENLERVEEEVDTGQADGDEEGFHL